jgi:hypothetical protein
LEKIVRTSSRVVMGKKKREAVVKMESEKYQGMAMAPTTMLNKKSGACGSGPSAEAEAAASSMEKLPKTRKNSKKNPRKIASKP